MVDLSSRYLGLDLSSPLVASASPLTGTLEGTVASGDHSNRRPPPESLNAIGDARIDCFEHFWQPSRREAAPLCYPPTAPSGQMQQCRPSWSTTVDRTRT